MLLRSISTVALLAGFAVAQNTEVIQAPVPQYAGEIDLATGIFTPAPQGGTLQAADDVIYDNACFGTGGNYFSPITIGTQHRLDEGRLPATNSTPHVGTVNAYTVKKFRMAYVSGELDPSIGGPGQNIQIKFWGDYDIGTGVAAAGTPLAAYNFTGLAGTTSTVTGALAGWIYTITLAVPLTVTADANGTYDASPALDTFGYSYDIPTGTAGKTQGAYLCGAPAAFSTCVEGAGTFYLSPGATSNGTGLGDSNTYTRDTAGVVANFTGNNNFNGGYFMELTGDYADCNNNDILDTDDLLNATSVDCDGNTNPDECDIAAGASDCNANGALDSCELLINPALDGNANGIIDSCECGLLTSYCTSGTTTNGCVGVINGSGTADANAGSGFTITASNLEGGQSGILFYGLNPAGASWGGGSSSFLCVKSPLERMGVTSTGGTFGLCDGSMSIDWNNYITVTAGAVGTPFAGGETVYAQAWFRDPPAPKTTSLSNGLSWTVCP